MKLKPKSIKQFVMNFGNIEVLHGTKWRVCKLPVSESDRPKLVTKFSEMVMAGLFKVEGLDYRYSMLLTGSHGTEAEGIIISLFSDNIVISVRKVVVCTQ